MNIFTAVPESLGGFFGVKPPPRGNIPLRVRLESQSIGKLSGQTELSGWAVDKGTLEAQFSI